MDDKEIPIDEKYSKLCMDYDLLRYENEALKHQINYLSSMIAYWQSYQVHHNQSHPNQHQSQSQSHSQASHHQVPENLSKLDFKSSVVQVVKIVKDHRSLPRKRKIDHESFDYDLKDSTSRKEKQRAVAEVKEVLSKACRQNPKKQLHVLHELKGKITEKEGIDETEDVKTEEEENQLWDSFKSFFAKIYELKTYELGKNIIRLLLLAVTFSVQEPSKSAISKILGISRTSMLLEQTLELKGTYDQNSIDSLKSVVEYKKADKS